MESAQWYVTLFAVGRSEPSGWDAVPGELKVSSCVGLFATATVPPVEDSYYFFFTGHDPHPAGYLTEHHFDDPCGNSSRCDDVLCTLLALNQGVIKRIRPPNSKLEK